MMMIKSLPIVLLLSLIVLSCGDAEQKASNDALTSDMNSPFYPVEKEGLWGYVDTFGEMRIELQFSDAQLFKGGYAIVEDKNGIGLINKYGTYEIPPEWADIQFLEHNGFLLLDNHDQYGFMDSTFNWVSKPRFNEIHNFKNGILTCQTDDSLYVFHNHREIAKLKFSDEVTYATKSHIAYSSYLQEGLMRLSGENVGSPRAAEIVWISDSIVAFDEYSRTQPRVFFFNLQTGDSILTEQPYYNLEYNEGQPYFLVSDASMESKTVLDKELNVLVRDCSSMDYFPEDSLSVIYPKEGAVIFLTAANNQIKVDDIDYVRSVANGKAIVEKDYLDGLVSLDGDWLLPTEFMTLQYVNDNIYNCRNELRYAVYDAEKRKVIAENYVASWFENGYLVVVQNDTGKVGCINAQGETIIPCSYKYISLMFAGQFKLHDDYGKVCIVDSEENIIIPYKYSKIAAANEAGYYICITKDRVDIVSKYNKLINTIEFENVQVVQQFGTAFILIQETYGYNRTQHGGKNFVPACIINRHGKVILPFSLITAVYEDEDIVLFQSKASEQEDETGIHMLTKGGKLYNIRL